VDPSLDEAALASARQATFKPATKDGKPVAVWVQLPMRFALK
jgi:TonB family protein